MSNHHRAMCHSVVSAPVAPRQVAGRGGVPSVTGAMRRVEGYLRVGWPVTDNRLLRGRCSLKGHPRQHAEVRQTGPGESANCGAGVVRCHSNGQPRKTGAVTRVLFRRIRLY